MTVRAWAVLVLAVLIVAAAVTAWSRIPWQAPPAPRADQLAALHSLPVDAVARARSYRAAARPGTYVALMLSFAVALILGLTPAGARVVAACGRPFGGNWIARALLGGLAVLLLASVVTVPVAAYQHTLARRYGLSTQSWAGWTVDLLKGYAVGAVLGGLALLGFYAIGRYAPRFWWAWASALAAALVVLMSFVFPVLVEPIFNTFTPMPDSPLRTRLLALADRDGVPVHDVLVADASRRTQAVNAYVSGLGSTRRIVVYDTLLEEADDAEVESVVAHELGHAADHDVLTGTLLGALGAAGAVITLYLLGSWGGLLRRAGVGSITDPRSIGLVLALVAIAGLLSGPAQSLISRRIEARADHHALELTCDPATFERMQAGLSQRNLSDPDPNRLEYLMFASHPSTVQRMAAARVFAREAPCVPS